MPGQHRWVGVPHPAIWAKLDGFQEPYPLALHLLDTAAAVGAIWDLWLRDGLRDRLYGELGPHARAIACFTAGVHDLGKANPVFAGQLAGARSPLGIADARQSLEDAGFDLHPNVDLASLAHQPRSFPRRHEQVSSWALAAQQGHPWMESDDWANPVLAAESWLSLVALGHHGRYDVEDPGDISTFSRAFGGQWESARGVLRRHVQLGLDLENSQLPSSISPTAVILLTGLTVIADRLASGRRRVEAAQAGIAQGSLDPSDPGRWIEQRSTMMRQAVIRELGIFDSWGEPEPEILRGNAPRGVQIGAAEVGSGLWSVMTPTGSGKTEAALLRHSAHTERLVFLLPTQATANSLLRRLTTIFEKTSNVAALAHGQAIIEDLYATGVQGSESAVREEQDGPRGLFPTDFVRMASARLLAPVCVGTVDQALMGVLPLPWTPLRLLALANAHVVVDEAHTLDPYQSVLMRNLLWWLGEVGARVTLLSATMPSAQRNDFLNAYGHRMTPPGEDREVGDAKISAAATFPSTFRMPRPRDAVRDEAGSRQIPMNGYPIALFRSEAEDVVNAHVEWARRMREAAPRARLGIVVNVIDRSAEIAERLRIAGERVILLHSRMTAEHRRRAVQQLEREIGRGGSGEALVVVGTQAIEASLDIDLDALSTDLAPAPSLIQRAGRAWRHETGRRHERLPGAAHLPLHVVRGTRANAALPYLLAVLNRAWAFLEARDAIHMPEDAQYFVETSAVDLQRDLDVSIPELDELARLAEHLSAARSAAIDWTTILEPSVTATEFATFGHQRLPQGAGDHGTRLIERESSRCIVLGDPELIPGAWPGAASDLMSVGLAGADLRAISAASVSLTGAVRGLALRTGTMMESRSGFVDGSIALDLRSSESAFVYDPLLGLRPRTAQTRS